MGVGEHAVCEEERGGVVGVRRVGQLREKRRNGVELRARGYDGRGSWEHK